MRTVLGHAACLVFLASGLSAQTVLTAGFGQLMYDAGGDLAYPAFVVNVNRVVAPSVSIGAIASYAFVGTNYPSNEMAIFNEGVLRAYGTLSLSQPVLHAGGSERWAVLASYGGIGAGYIRSAWEGAVGTAPPESLALRSRSGIGFGTFGGLELRPKRRVVVRLQLIGLWLDRLGGQRTFNVDQHVLVGYRL